MHEGRTWKRLMTLPVRGDLIAGVSVALVLVPQSMAYAELAGLDPVHGLYVAAVAPLAGALIGSSPYLQTGPVAVTSLLTLGALSGLADPFTPGFAALAALLAIVVGVIRLAVGIVGAGPIAYLMSQPVVASFTSAAAVLIVASQVPGLMGVAAEGGNPAVAAAAVLVSPQDWRFADVLLGLGAIALVLGGRRLSPVFPGALVAVVAASGWSAAIGYDGRVVGDISVGLGLHLDLPFGDLGQLLIPGLVIALVGFAEPASIARRYAAEDRRPWNSNREFLGQGLANVAAGMAGGYPAGGSFSRSALNRLSGAKSRWSGAITGAAVLALLPVAGLLAPLPSAVLAGLVIAAVISLIDVRPIVRYWRWSRPQFVVALATAVATIGLAPHVERGVLLGVAMALAVHLWRELAVSVPSQLKGDALHLWPTGVLYFGSAPSLERTVNELVAAHRDVTRIVIHMGGLGRVDLTGAITLRDLAEDAQAGGVVVEIRDAGPHAARLLTRVLGDLSTVTLTRQGETAAEPEGKGTQE